MARSRLTSLLVLAVVILGGLAVAVAVIVLRDDPESPPPVVGSWAGVDGDGSYQSFEVKPGNHPDSYRLDLRDDAATVCGGAPVTGVGAGRLANGTLRTIVRLECANGKSLITEYPLTYHVENDTLVDLDGVAWSRIEAAEE